VFKHLKCAEPLKRRLAK